MPFASSGEAEIWWESAGAGVPLLLINGLGSPAQTWWRVTRALQDTFRMLTFDNRGVGRTGLVDGPYTVPAMARDAVTVLDAAGCSDAHVLGLSMGGLIAQELALSFPDRVRSLILASTHAGIPHAAADPADVDLEAVTALAAAQLLPAEQRVRSLVPYIYAPATDPCEIELDLQLRDVAPTSQEGFTRQANGVATWERLSELADLSMPVLVLHGRDDRLVPLVHGQRLAAAVPGARLQILDDASHQLFTDQEQRATRILREFIVNVENSVAAPR